MTAYTPAPWRYEASTKTIRAVPGNHWLATLDSWDGAIDHNANARLIAAAPALLEALQKANWMLSEIHGGNEFSKDDLWQTIQRAKNAITNAA